MRRDGRVWLMYALLIVLGTLVPLMFTGCTWLKFVKQDCRVSGCGADQVCQAQDSSDPLSPYICVPKPEEPPVPPTPEPPPVVEPPPPTPPPPTPPPVVDHCPKPLAPGAYVMVKVSPYPPSGADGNNGLYVTPYVVGDPEFCRLIHGVSVEKCHLEGWKDQQACEVQLLGGCPEFEYRMTGGQWTACLARPAYGVITCDHLGTTLTRDDPQTPEFEGLPKECAEQKTGEGPLKWQYKAGFYAIAHIDKGFAGEVRACRRDHDPQGCSDKPRPIVGR